MDFEYDPQKSESNKIRHGIDFEEAKALWDVKMLFRPRRHRVTRSGFWPLAVSEAS